MPIRSLCAINRGILCPWQLHASRALFTFIPWEIVNLVSTRIGLEAVLALCVFKKTVKINLIFCIQ